MKLSFVKIFLLTIFFSAFFISKSFSQSGWFSLNSGTTINLSSIHFPPTATGFTGYVCGNGGTILKTIDGGQNWISQITGVTNDLHGIYFAEADIGYAVGEDGRILKTTNGGTNWVTLNSGITDPIYSVMFLNANTGYTAGIGIDRILKTTNGGQTWSIQTAGGIFGQFGVSFADANTGCTVGLNGSINRTTNGGTNWTLVRQTNPDDILLCVFFKNNNSAFAVGDNGLILKSSNGGLNWSNVSFGSDLLHSVIFVTDDIGFVAGTGIDGVILKTTNGGVSWTQQVSGTSSALFSISFTDLNTGYTCGSQGAILKTTTGGLMTGFSSNTSEMPDKYFLGQNYPNPFNPGSIINYEIPTNVKSQTSNVNITVYDALGKIVATLINKKQTSGSYRVEFDAGNFPSGVYFYSLEIDGVKVATKRMVILK